MSPVSPVLTIIQVFTTRANCCLGPAPVGGQTNWVLIIDTVFLTNLINAASKLNTKSFVHTWYTFRHSQEVIFQEKQNITSLWLHCYCTALWHVNMCHCSKHSLLFAYEIVMELPDLIASWLWWRSVKLRWADVVQCSGGVHFPWYLQISRNL